MSILDIFDLAASFGYIEKYFKYELAHEDFWELIDEGYQTLNEQEKKEKWFSVDSKKLNEKVLQENYIFIVSEREKNLLLKAFQLIRSYSKKLPENATFKERLFTTKQHLPPVFFSSEDGEIKEGKIIPLKLTKNEIV